ncbi:MAG: hypothetical protein HPY87_10185 [Fervidobacterium sp.]|uniref:hypothetical protein n=1 Tax=Fervidobacterium sp. TaxID=1871331 RepID=UPI0025BA70D3|nr:hypothetical protein [Fervidobacterium sp.]NPU90227.1 hypothetical protein [Fervidobacterium sp.]
MLAQEKQELSRGNNSIIIFEDGAFDVNEKLYQKLLFSVKQREIIILSHKNIVLRALKVAEMLPDDIPAPNDVAITGDLELYYNVDTNDVDIVKRVLHSIEACGNFIKNGATEYYKTTTDFGSSANSYIYTLRESNGTQPKRLVVTFFTAMNENSSTVFTGFDVVSCIV